MLPVRVLRHGTWVGISTRLVAAAGGGWMPAAVSTPEVFSGGGPGPMVTVIDPASGRTVRVWWPAALPRPAVTGSVALYRGVLPGVDLRLEATGSGYDEVLIVHDAAAAANPALRSFRLTITAAPGLSAANGPDGSFTVSNAANGKKVLSFGQSMMWDSSHTQHLQGQATAGSAGSGRITMVPVRYQVTGPRSAVVITSPPAAALTGPKVRYPLFIDPQTGDQNIGYYVQVMQGNTGATFAWNSTTNTTSQANGITEVGWCGYTVQNSQFPCNWAGGITTYTDRDYFQFDTSGLEPNTSDGALATIDYVDFNADETANSAGCTPEPTAVWSTSPSPTGTISSSTTWGGPEGAQIASTSSDKGGSGSTGSCPAGDVDFNSGQPGNGGLINTLQEIASGGYKTVTLELRAVSENDYTQYKTFKDNPTLNVYYNYGPEVPKNLSVTNAVTCDSSMAYLPVGSSTFTAKLNATDKDDNPSPLPVDLGFLVQNDPAGSWNAFAWQGPDDYIKSDDYAPGSWTTPSLTTGTPYEFQVEAKDIPQSGDNGLVGAQESELSNTMAFTALTPPTQKPTISSYDYPQNQWGQPSGVPGTFTVGTGGASNIAGFAYSFDGGAGSEPVPAADGSVDCGQNSYALDGGLGTTLQTTGTGAGLPTTLTTGSLELVRGSTAQIVIPTGLSSGQNTLYVVTFDKAHNPSGEAEYTFYLPQNYSGQSVHYQDPTTLAQSGPNSSLLWTQNDCCSVDWKSGHQLAFKGTAVGQSFTLSFQPPSAGIWDLGAEMTTAGNYGQVEVALDGTVVAGTGTTPWDGWDGGGPVSMQYLDLGTPYLDLTSTPHTLTFTITGQASGATGFDTGLSFISLSPTNRYEGESFTQGPGSSCIPGSSAASTFTAPSGQAAVPKVQSLSGWPWSDNSQLMFANSAKGASFTLAFDAPVQSDYALGVNLVTAKDYGQLQFTLDPTATDFNLNTTAYYPGMVNQVIDGYTAAISSKYVFLGGVSLSAGVHCLQVTVTGTNLASSGNMFNAGIDYLEAVPVTGAVYSSFTTAMNNLGIATDNAQSFGGSFDGTSGSNNLSLTALQDAGINPGTATGAGSSFSMHGASFTMPELNAPGGTVLDDNVVADGQTIQIPPVYASDVALLVAATCVTTPQLTATLGYVNGSSSQPAIPSVPNWYGGALGSTAIVLDHVDNGTTPGSVQAAEDL